MDQMDADNSKKSPSYRTRLGTIMCQLRLIYRTDTKIAEAFEAPCKRLMGNVSLRQVCESDEVHDGCAAHNSYFLHDLFVELHADPNNMTAYFVLPEATVIPLRR